MERKNINVRILIGNPNLPRWIATVIKLIEKHKDITLLDLVVLNKSENLILEETNSTLCKFLLNFDRRIFKTRNDQQSSVNLVNYFNEDSNFIIKHIDRIDDKIISNIDFLIPIGFSVIDKELKRIPNKIYIYELNKNLNLINKLGISNIIYGLLSNPNIIEKNNSISFLNYLSISNLLPISKGLNLFYKKYAILVYRNIVLRILGIENAKYDKLKNYFLHENKTVNYFSWAWLYLTKVLKNSIVQRVYNGQWVLFFNNNFSLKNYKDFSNYKLIRPPKNTFWADPQIIVDDQNGYIFIEEFDYNKHKAHISVMVINSSGQYKNPKKVLDKKHHLSFPHIFKFENKWYMIPETEQNKTIELYEAEEFPFKWKFKMNLMENIIALDTNIFFHHNKWWLFTTISELDGIPKYDELWLFYSDDFLGGIWHPHPQNPVVENIKTSRPAGAIFKIDDQIYRPAQNSSIHYGYGLTFNKITCLNEKEYTEEIEWEAKPDFYKNNISLHTFSYSQNFSIIDGKILRFKYFINRRNSVYKKIKK